MSKTPEEIQPIPPKDRNDFDLLELVCQLHSRALSYPSKEMHDASVEARNELENRLRTYATQTALSKREGEVEEAKGVWRHANDRPKVDGDYTAKNSHGELCEAELKKGSWYNSSGHPIAEWLDISSPLGDDDPATDYIGSIFDEIKLFPNVSFSDDEEVSFWETLSEHLHDFAALHNAALLQEVAELKKTAKFWRSFVDNSFEMLQNCSDTFYYSSADATWLNWEDHDWAMPIIEKYGWEGANAVFSYLRGQEVIAPHQSAEYKEALQILRDTKPKIETVQQRIDPDVAALQTQLASALEETGRVREELEGCRKDLEIKRLA